jgi:hypothetical protein
MTEAIVKAHMIQACLTAILTMMETMPDKARMTVEQAEMQTMTDDIVRTEVTIAGDVIRTGDILVMDTADIPLKNE